MVYKFATVENLNRVVQRSIVLQPYYNRSITVVKFMIIGFNIGRSIVREGLYI